MLEQSIDIDADFLVSAFCPTDMLFQRLGRLWRHTTTTRVPNACCEAFLLVPSSEAIQTDIKKAFGKSSFVYEPYVLWRSLHVWKEVSSVTLPADIRPLIDATYDGEMVVEPSLIDQVDALKREMDQGITSSRQKKVGRNQLKQLAKNTLTLIGAQATDERPPTRYSDQETVDVLLLQELRLDISKESSVLVSLDKQEVKIPFIKSKIDRLLICTQI